MVSQDTALEYDCCQMVRKGQANSLSTYHLRCCQTANAPSLLWRNLFNTTGVVHTIMISSANIHEDDSEFNQSVIIGHGEKGEAQLHLHEQTISICDGVLMPPENSPSSSPQSATRSETKEPGTCFKKFDKGRQWSDAQSI